MFIPRIRQRSTLTNVVILMVLTLTGSSANLVYANEPQPVVTDEYTHAEDESGDHKHPRYSKRELRELEKRSKIIKTAYDNGHKEDYSKGYAAGRAKNMKAVKQCEAKLEALQQLVSNEPSADATTLQKKIAEILSADKAAVPAGNASGH